jgi:hypothetical protein
MMRIGRIVPLLLIIPATALADDLTSTTEGSAVPPSYKVLRFDESYLYLSDASKRTDLFDPIKYIPLRTGDPSWYLTIGGEVRERFESIHNPDFGIEAPNDSYWLQRLTLLGDLHLGERVRFFVEGISGLIEGERPPAPPPQDDPIELQFAFVDLVPYLNGDEQLTLRGGRFGMSLGSGRLVATRAAPNIPFKFDGFEAFYRRPSWEFTAFVTRPAKERPHQFDSTDDSIAFWGLYATHWFDAPHKLGADLYYFGIEREPGRYASGTAHEHRHSFGLRLFGEKDQWDWNGEAVVQAGRFGHDSILAWTASLDAGYTWDTMWKPRAGLKVDVASGDQDPNDGQQGTFDALFFKSGYFNDASLLRPANLIDVHPNIVASLTRSLSVNSGVDVFWRYSQEDAIYSPPGFVSLPALKNRSAYVGTALDVNVQWQVQRHVTVLASYVHFFTESYVRAAGGGDVNYFSTTVSFLF